MSAGRGGGGNGEGWAWPSGRSLTGRVRGGRGRTSLDLYANVIHCQSLPGVETRHRDIDILIVRENTEGEYSSLEHEVTAPGHAPSATPPPPGHTPCFGHAPLGVSITLATLPLASPRCLFVATPLLDHTLLQISHAPAWPRLIWPRPFFTTPPLHQPRP